MSKPKDDKSSNSENPNSASSKTEKVDTTSLQPKRTIVLENLQPKRTIVQDGFSRDNEKK